MHIGLNLVYLVPGYTGGTETYARALIPELVAAAPDHRFTAFVNREAGADAAGPWGTLIPAVTVPVRARNRLEWVRGEQELLPRLAARAGVDVVHSLANTAPAWGQFRRVVTVHDLSFRLVPDAHSRLLSLGMRLLVPLGARRAQRIIVDAASTREDLHRLLRTPRDKVDVIPLGLGAPQSQATAMPEAELRAWLDAGVRRLALCVAAKRAHKNLIRLIGALAQIPAEDRPLLVLPGYSTPHEARLRARATELKVEDSVRFLDWVSPEAIEGLYAAADVFVFPSLMEGFGLPVLEAMARGVPVVCSNSGSLPEVAGDAAVLFDPLSEPAIAAAITHVLADRALAEHLRSAGRARAEQFTWAATAKATLDTYRRTLSAARLSAGHTDRP